MTLLQVSDTGDYIEPEPVPASKQHCCVNESYADVSIDELRPEVRSKHPDHWSNNIDSGNFDPRELADGTVDDESEQHGASVDDTRGAIDPRELAVDDDDSDGDLRFDQAWETDECDPDEERNFDPRTLADAE